MNASQSSALVALANGISPADARDEGAAAGNAGKRLAERVKAGVNAALYQAGVEAAESIAKEKHGRGVTELTACYLTRISVSMPPLV
jgi:hypothetical protein